MCLGLFMHILIVILPIIALQSKKICTYLYLKEQILWFGPKYDQSWQKWPKLCSVNHHLGYESGLESLKRFWERQVFPWGLAWESSHGMEGSELGKVDQIT